MEKYNYMANFDSEDLQDGSTMAERFFFSEKEVLSYNQAILLIGNHIRTLSTHKFRVTAVLDGKVYVFYQGDAVFYNWFADLEADFFRKYSLVNFKDETTEALYQLDKIEVGGRYCYHLNVE